MKSLRELLKDDMFVTVKAWDGTLASIPASMVKEFKEEQEKLKAEHIKAKQSDKK